MANEDVDDIFKDFEHKVEGKEEHTEEAEKELSEEEHLKKRYQKAEHALKQKYQKEKEALEEKGKKEMIGHHETLSSKKSMNIEKAAYVAIILVLVAYIAIDLAFYHRGSTGVETDQTITAAAVEVKEETEEVEEVVEEVIGEEKNETLEEETVVEEEKVLSGKITLNIDNIYTEVSDNDDDLGYINKIVFTIDNGKDKVLTPVVDVYAYDSELDESWETKSRGQYTHKAGISPGDKYTGTIDLTPKSFRKLGIKKSIRLTLNDTEDGFITAVNEKVLIS